MECPDCARANPLLKEAAAKYKIPWVRHDFPLPFHNWSFHAAVNARWFDTKSKALGDEYRDAGLRQPDLHLQPRQPAPVHSEVCPEPRHRPALRHRPAGQACRLVKADYALGQRIGIEHTPTIWVVTANSKGAPFVEVVDRSKLFQLIDQALADTAGAKPTVKPMARKPQPLSPTATQSQTAHPMRCAVSCLTISYLPKIVILSDPLFLRRSTCFPAS